MKKLLLLMCLLIAQSSMASADVADPDIFNRRPSISNESQTPKFDLFKSGNDLEIKLQCFKYSTYHCIVKNFEDDSIIQEFEGRCRRSQSISEYFEYPAIADGQSARYIVQMLVSSAGSSTSFKKMVLIEKIDGEEYVFVEASK